MIICIISSSMIIKDFDFFFTIYYTYNMNILFLDIDGVLNSRNTKLYDNLNNKNTLIDHKNITVLKELIDNISYEIVLISSWIKNDNLKDILNIFQDYGIKIKGTIDKNKKKEEGINKWVKINNPDNILIFDDESILNIKSPFQNNFYKINSGTGLIKSDIVKIKAFLT